MAHGSSGIEKKLHPATGEVPPVYLDSQGNEKPICDNCGRMYTAVNGILCKACLNMPDIRGNYEMELRGKPIEDDLDSYLEEILTAKIATLRTPNPFIEEQERKASYPRLKPVDTEKS